MGAFIFINFYHKEHGFITDIPQTEDPHKVNEQSIIFEGLTIFLEFGRKVVQKAVEFNLKQNQMALKKSHFTNIVKHSVIITS